MWIYLFVVLVIQQQSSIAAPPGTLQLEPKITIVEPQKPSDEIVSIVEAHHPESLVTVVETISPEEILEDSSSLVTMVEEHKQPLPDTSSITGELTEKLGVTNFFALWLVFNDPNDFELQRGTDFSILAPREVPPVDSTEASSSLVRKLLLDHVILGRRLRLAARTDLQSFTVTTLGGRNVNFTNTDGSWYANGAKIIEPETEVPPSGELIVLESYVFSDYNVTSSPSQETPTEFTTITSDTSGNLADELSKLPAVFNLTRVPVFNKFLQDANVSQLLEQDEQYTVLFPMDRAFQKWHPIDWGFYPFSVPEFTIDVVRSHFLKGAIRFDDIVDNQTATTITGKTVTFRKALTGEVTANGVNVMRRDVALRGGNVLVVPEVLFVTHRIVQQLREHNKDKETPPLLAYPWWNAQFLSHAYLAIETNSNFSSIQRLMNAASNLHLHVPGKNYSFFVPTDEAFTRAKIEVPTWFGDRCSGELLTPATISAIEAFILRHLVPGRLYQRQLTSGMQLNALDNSTHTLSQLENGMFAVDRTSLIEEGDVFVYNLGTMFYVDGVLGSEPELAKLREVLSELKQPPTPATSELGEEVEEGETTNRDLLLEDTTTSVTQSTTVKPETAETVKTEIQPVITETEPAKTDAEPVKTDIEPVKADLPPSHPNVVDSVAVESKNTESNDIPAASVAPPISMSQ